MTQRCKRRINGKNFWNTIQLPERSYNRRTTEGHPGIKATTLSYAEINDEMLAMLDKPHPSYYLLLLGFLMAFGTGYTKLCHTGRCRNWIQWNKSSNCLGILYYKFRFLDWNWTRRDILFLQFFT